MPYTSPSNTAVDFKFQSGYSSPTNTSVNFTFNKTTDAAQVAATISQSTTTAGLSTPTYQTEAELTATETATADTTPREDTTATVESATTAVAPTFDLQITLDSVIVATQANLGGFRILSVTDNQRGPDEAPNAVFVEPSDQIDYKNQGDEVIYPDANNT